MTRLDYDNLKSGTEVVTNMSRVSRKLTFLNKSSEMEQMAVCKNESGVIEEIVYVFIDLLKN